MSLIYTEYNSCNGSTTSLSTFWVFRSCTHGHRLGRIVFSHHANTSLRLAALGILCAKPAGNHRHRFTDCLFFPPSFSERKTGRSQCHRPAGDVVRRVWRHTRLVTARTTRHSLCSSRPCGRAGSHRVFHAAARKSALETSGQHR